MSSHIYTETSSATMRSGFPTPPKPTLGAPNLFIVNNLLQYICKCTQTHMSTISKKMNLLYVEVDPSLYTHYSAGKAYPYAMYPFPNNFDERHKIADLPSIARDNCVHLSPSHYTLLLKFEELFDGMLGDWKLPTVSFESKEGTKLCHGRPYPIPKIHKATLMKNIDCLVSIGVMKWQPPSQLVSPSFIIPKKDHTVRIISDFGELNKRIVKKPYPIPKISTTLQELEGFTYTPALDLNMG
jgi:hypothetical protein